MPRKQRFKPSRKPKPIPPNEDAVMGRSVNSTNAHDETTPVDVSAQPSEDGKREQDSGARPI